MPLLLSVHVCVCGMLLSGIERLLTRSPGYDVQQLLAGAKPSMNALISGGWPPRLDCCLQLLTLCVSRGYFCPKRRFLAPTCLSAACGCDVVRV
jgi:hypothetical protein